MGKNSEKLADADLKKKLEDLLKPSWTHQELEDIPRSRGSLCREYIPMKRKVLDIGE